ncbi:MAG: Nif3-like dinuclear metal center hexameric protein [Parachlamydia sp.]|nr:Nif3-like dinuclear metal center hexameric protein [Parachlamydia sp.]
MELRSLIDYLQTLFPDEGGDACPNGMQVEGGSRIKKIATAVSASLETIQAAIEWEADALIVHHGLFWNRDNYPITGIKRKKLALLLERGISLFAYHLPLDRHPELGNNWKAARDLSWDNLQPFGSFNGIPLGVKGTIKSTSRASFQKQLEDYYGHIAACAWGGPEKIETVGLISGGAYKMLHEASQEGLDAFITGNFDEPAWSGAFEEKINFLALGHSATERIGPAALCEHLKKELNLPCQFIDIPNPF